VTLGDGNESLKAALVKKCHDLSQINQEMKTSIWVHEDLTPKQAAEYRSLITQAEEKSEKGTKTGSNFLCQVVGPQTAPCMKQDYDRERRVRGVPPRPRQSAEERRSEMEEKVARVRRADRENPTIAEILKRAMELRQVPKEAKKKAAHL
jgi:hypothetical protein